MNLKLIEKPATERDLPAQLREAFLDYDPVFVDSAAEQHADESANRSDSHRAALTVED